MALGMHDDDQVPVTHVTADTMHTPWTPWTEELLLLPLHAMATL